MGIRKEKIKVYDMTCTSCEAKVERTLRKINGVLSVKASFAEQFTVVEYDDALCSIGQIKSGVKNAGYSTEKPINFGFIGILIIGLAIIFLGNSTAGFDMEEKLKGASYLVLFIVGALTSLHCVGMCGGIMLSQSITKDNTNKLSALKPSLLYNLGRVVSYTIIGGIVGALGSALSLSLGAKSFLQIFAGIFMIIMGLNMTGLPLFRKLQIRLPWSSCSVKSKSKAPFVIGLLNGLMPCGPLQTMQLYALGTGSAVAGATSMFMFSIGTVPLMLTFGLISGLLSSGYTQKILKFSGVLVVVLGIIMSNRGLALSGVSLNPMRSIMTMMASKSQSQVGANSSNLVKPVIKDGIQTINMTADSRGYTPNVLLVKKGVPVKWVIDGKQITSCNNAIVVPSLKIQQKLKSGENIVNFTPQNTGDIKFSCWMGMINGVIKVVDDVDSTDASKAVAQTPPASSGGSCCGGTGDTTATQAPSIYGEDMSKVETSRLIGKSTSLGGLQTIKIKGIGYELNPIIVVINKGATTKITLDLTSFDNPEGKYTIVDANSGDELMAFDGKKGVNEVEFKAPKSGGFGILKDGNLLGIIEAVDNLKTVDLEKIRKQYIR